jgi:hypothetical protein
LDRLLISFPEVISNNFIFGSNPESIDGPISLSADEEGKIYVVDRYNHAVRMIHRKTSIITTIVGNYKSIDEEKNNPNETDPLKLNMRGFVALLQADSCEVILNPNESRPRHFNVTKKDVQRQISVRSEGSSSSDLLGHVPEDHPWRDHDTPSRVIRVE